MPTYFVSLFVSRAARLDDAALIRLFHAAAKRAACVPIEVAPAGLVIEAEAVSLGALEQMLREEVQENGGWAEIHRDAHLVTAGDSAARLGCTRASSARIDKRPRFLRALQQSACG